VSASVGAVAFSGDGSALAAVAGLGTGSCGVIEGTGRYGTLIWSARSVEARSGAEVTLPVQGDVAFDPGGSLVAIGETVWRTATRSRIAALDGIWALSPDGRLALVRRDGKLSVVRVPSGSHVSDLRGAGRSCGATFSPDASRVVTTTRCTDVGYSVALRLWNVVSGERIRWLGRAGGYVAGVSFSKDGRLVLVEFGDRFEGAHAEGVAAFDASSGGLEWSLNGPFSAVADDATLAAGARNDGVVEVIDVKTGLRTGLQTDAVRPLESVSFGPTDGVLVATDSVGDVHVVRCTICTSDDELLAAARAKLAALARFKPEAAPTAGVA
jgi:WD40 repeat protein